MKVTDEMIMAAAKQLAEWNWIDQDWDQVDQGCDCCGRGPSNTEGTVKEIKDTLTDVLTAALEAAPKKAKK